MKSLLVARVLAASWTDAGNKAVIPRVNHGRKTRVTNGRWASPVIIPVKDALVFALIPELKIKKKKTPRPNKTIRAVNNPLTK
ncbi:MAG: hypothetical protein D9V45_05540 [Chloroflexi bacterium]|nr:MAG: hypothetical protein D9V45_05540 [Chloroflexota bacterium]